MTAPVPTTPRIAFPGRILIVGCGAVSRCLQPLLLRHLDMDASRITVIDTDDVSNLIPDTIAAGVTFRQFEITPESFATDALTEFVGPGDLLINLAWNIDAGVIIGWCQDHGVMYLDTSVEEWDPYREVERSAGAHAVPPAHGAARAGGLAGRRTARPRSSSTAPTRASCRTGRSWRWSRSPTAILGGAAAEIDADRRTPARRRARRSRLRGAGDGDRHEGDPHLRARHPDQLRPEEARRVRQHVVGRRLLRGRRRARRARLGHPRGLAAGRTGSPTRAAPRTRSASPSRASTRSCARGCRTAGPIIGMVVRHGEAFTISDAPHGVSVTAPPCTARPCTTRTCPPTSPWRRCTSAA